MTLPPPGNECESKRCGFSPLAIASSNVEDFGINCAQSGKYSPLAVVPSAPLVCSWASTSDSVGLGLTGGSARGYRNGIAPTTSSAHAHAPTGACMRDGSAAINAALNIATHKAAGVR